MAGITNKVIETYSRRITNPVQRLRFQRDCLTRQLASDEGVAAGGWLRRRVRMLEIIAQIEPFSGEALRSHDRALLWLSDQTEILRSGVVDGRLVKAGCAAGMGVVLLAAVGIGVGRQSLKPGETADQAAVVAEASREVPAPDVWLVERRDGVELYSNGLEVSNEFLTHTGPRSYPVFAQENPQWRTARWRHDAAGIVFHTTESELAEFAPSNNEEILRVGRHLLQFIRREQLYNFLIDRFGRVHRIVPESEYAFHAGNSIWNDTQGSYLGLNQSFIGVAFETERSGAGTTAKNATDAQVRSARLLTEWLRHEYKILASDCIAHEMVSVNPDNMLIGYHTDWVGKFPFEQVGLPDNYSESLPSIAHWGFGYDDYFVQTIGGTPWPGMETAAQFFDQQADEHNLDGNAYRAQLKRRYKDLLDRLKAETPAKTWAEASLAR